MAHQSLKEQTIKTCCIHVDFAEWIRGDDNAADATTKASPNQALKLFE